MRRAQSVPRRRPAPLLRCWTAPLLLLFLALSSEPTPLPAAAALAAAGDGASPAPEPPVSYLEPDAVSAHGTPEVLLPPRTRVYAVGDVHGEDALLEGLLAQVRTDARAAGCGLGKGVPATGDSDIASQPAEGLRCHLVFLGDYVDRGPGSRRVLEMVMDEVAAHKRQEQQQQHEQRAAQTPAPVACSGCSPAEDATARLNWSKHGAPGLGAGAAAAAAAGGVASLDDNRTASANALLAAETGSSSLADRGQLWAGVHALLANHEDLMLGFLVDASDAWDPRARSGDGAADTLASYGVDARSYPSAAQLRTAALAAIPPAHVAFLRALPRSWRCGNLLFVHAGVRPRVALDAQRPHDLVWIREPFLRAALRGPVLPAPDDRVVVVHGHTIRTKPELGRGRVGVDTGAFHSGQLTCAVFDGERGSVRFLAQLSAEAAARRRSSARRRSPPSRDEL